MAKEAEDWERISPEELLPAIRQVRESFTEAAFHCQLVTQELCHAKLHSAAPKRTASSIFSFWMKSLTDALARELEKGFNHILEVGLAHSEKLKQHPIEWAKAHLGLLIKSKDRAIKRWVKEACDKQGGSKAVNTREDFMELVRWNEWRAPRLTRMEPSGNLPYDPAMAWTREDEGTTQELLQGLSDRVTRFLETDLKRIVGDAYLRLAKERKSSVAGASDKASSSADRPRKRRKANSRTRKRDAVIFAAVEEQKKGLAYCRFLDARHIFTPSLWQDDGCPSTHCEAYKSSGKWKKKIQDEKHRATLRMLQLKKSDPNELERLLERVARPTR
jgi:hypothetical protein